ncbi:hypothetical protein VW23_000440 [Devosia insulae DS-56]|uniref:Ava_C0101 and related proteins n=2 Tax=Devosia insulae TaxID=408174 RepID=A0A1E5XHP7_9HYPH|nr:hypothetical protein VW23_000440 [Devosia insulae DS-56]
MKTTDWPDIPYGAWRDTCDALHLYAQVVGKYRLARTPWLCHSWHATLYPSALGLTTGLVPDGPGGIELILDLVEHRVIGAANNGRRAGFKLASMSVAQFDTELRILINELGGTPHWHWSPNEVAAPVPFAEDTAQRPYDADAVSRFHRALILVALVFAEFRTAFLGKASPVHLFWGSFDLAVTRFSGRRAPIHPGGVPFLPDAVTREAYSHEVSSAGFWPGGGGVDYPCFYSYAYPAPPGFAPARIQPSAAHYDVTLGEFILPYEAVRTSPDPAGMLMSFLQDTYRTAADLANWDVRNLECQVGRPLRPRQI